MPRSARGVASALERKGFERRESKDAYFHLWVDGKKTPIYTKMSQGEREIHDGLLAAMARQLHLRRAQFNDLIECPLSKEEYIELLRERGQIGGEAVEVRTSTAPPPRAESRPMPRRKQKKSKKQRD